ncbi:glycine cleavage system protein R [Aeromonas simiae]|uniref:glycine cleavage system protein R n=1 Tax=Aeromonas simiae TaxID=218936 RepID=UPI0005A6DDD9|nr:ACT domain-containing protein [Aeromonas simiae]MDO2947302.1 glycine cleavage system protein R [Aeromonas simiae]MDO2951158.1 glycine cleavage system protein R [Aeromonas simiae]MDO2954742.1 glycine cleavage system protein R [Aeromonas simiae]
MQKQLVITVIGPDRPGIVESLAEAVSTAGGSWQASSMSELAGQFAGILQVTLPEAAVAPLHQALNALPDLRITLVEGAEVALPDHELLITLTANDRPGIVHELSAALHRLSVNVMELSTGCEAAAHSGAPLFYAHALLALPQGMTQEELVAALESLSDDLMIDIDEAG